MPKGHKSQYGYATVKKFDGGNDYRTIASEMTARGFKMNHATARNIFLSALSKIAEPIQELHDSDATVSIQKAVRDPRFQESVAEILSSINASVKNR
jgi:hypothetical protein|tara:strand:+ start:2375 stop:2665 length:291 start_codon:yes stop_codon:yes gene_type:complete